jgi:hypothetical protein
MTPHEMIPPARRRLRFGAALRWAGFAALGAAGAVFVVALAVVATAAALIGLVVAAGAVLALRFSPAVRRRRADTQLLEGRRTADGWEVEAIGPKSR